VLRPEERRGAEGIRRRAARASAPKNSIPARLSAAATGDRLMTQPINPIAHTGASPKQPIRWTAV
jgi:hypothetical protein